MNERGAERGRTSGMFLWLRLAGRSKGNDILHRVPVVMQRDEGVVDGECIENKMRSRTLDITPTHPTARLATEKPSVKDNIAK